MTRWLTFRTLIRASVMLLSLITVISYPFASEPEVTFKQNDNSLEIAIGGSPFATYIFKDTFIPRPFFCHVNAPGNIPITRNHPPIEGVDPTDHDLFHPGIWAAYGDIDGFDFWRNQSSIKHARFVKEPTGGTGEGRFSVLDHYISSLGEPVCQETCHYTIKTFQGHYLLIAQSEFRSNRNFVFGDQEEMGLGVRVATPISVKKGGRILNSDGLKNEKEVWGKTADWCDYSGSIGGKFAGITLMAAPDNFRQSWFHARDYGLLVANSFGRNAFTKKEKSTVTVKPGRTFKQCYGMLIHTNANENDLDIDAAYQRFLDEIKK